MAPIDLRIDHVYLVSCKYESDILANVSPGRLFDGLLATTGTWDRGDWYAAVAAAELLELYRACIDATGLSAMPIRAVALRQGGAGRAPFRPVRNRDLSRRAGPERPTPGSARR